MTDYDEMERIERRTRRYWFEDGIGEIGLGIVFVLLATYFAASAAVPPDSPLKPFVTLFLPVLIVVLSFTTNRAIQAAKDRYVHPRTGYLSFPKPSSRRRIASAVIAALVSTIITFTLARLPEGAPWILLGAIFWYIGTRASMLRLPLQGAMAALTGVALSWWRVPDTWAAAILFGASGVSLAVVGLWAFRSYLRASRGGGMS